MLTQGCNIDYAHKAYVYTLFETFSNQSLHNDCCSHMGTSWNCNENNTKNKCIVKNAFI